MAATKLISRITVPSAVGGGCSFGSRVMYLAVLEIHQKDCGILLITSQRVGSWDWHD
jgi:hypothetical protein